MELKSYAHILRNKTLFNWLPAVRPLVYSLFTINHAPVIVLGNQKSGTSAIAALLAKATGMSYDIDIAGFRNPEYTALHQNETALLPLVQQRAKIEFSKDVVKEPNLTFLLPKLLETFPKATYVFIVRDPRANIRSTLNRLKIPGTAGSIDPADYPEISPIWRSILYNEWVEETQNPSHIYRSARRWRLAAEAYLRHRERLHLIRYEDFNQNKTDAIYDLARRIGKEITHDISDKVDIQFQVKGKRPSSYKDYFGAENLRMIESVCSPIMEQFDYQPEILVDAK